MIQAAYLFCKFTIPIMHWQFGATWGWELWEKKESRLVWQPILVLPNSASFLDLYLYQLIYLFNYSWLHVLTLAWKKFLQQKRPTFAICDPPRLDYYFHTMCIFVRILIALFLSVILLDEQPYILFCSHFCVQRSAIGRLQYYIHHVACIFASTWWRCDGWDSF